MKIILKEKVDTQTENEIKSIERITVFNDISVFSNGVICVGKEVINTGNDIDIDIFVKTGKSTLDYKRYKEMTKEAYKHICKLVEKAVNENKTLKLRIEKSITKSILTGKEKISGFIDIDL